MGLSILDVTPSEAHRKEILRQAETNRLGNRLYKQRICSRRRPSNLRLFFGRLLIGWGQRLSEHAAVGGGSA
jgi:hypothetical protein